MSSHTPRPNLSRSLTTPFYNMPFLLDQIHNQGYGDSSYRGMRSPMMISSPIEQNEQEQGDSLVGIDSAILEGCKRETYMPSHLSHLSQGMNRGSHHAECPICLENFETNDKILRLPCNHPFHVDCIVPWLRSRNDTCPFCRAKITTKKSFSFGALHNNGTRFQTSPYPYSNVRDIYANYGHMPLHINTFNERNLSRGVTNGPTRSDVPPNLAYIIPSSNNQLLSSTMRNHHHIPVTYRPNVREIPISSGRGPSRETLISDQRASTRESLNSNHLLSSQRSGTTPPIVDIPISNQRPSGYPNNLIGNSGSIRRQSNHTHWHGR
ncbi:hypothetical protein GOP47_0020728 [Adiantum capillus-veneris]|uniref:RING-type domain-containing protein n=1 Tax=Adiantum capillus-veneris TaxID=13818 RepID=A0A9D4Z6C7_ADICA|nr:hypothetical protein GOP47_0020728 [Adiantum capillus-veneris]